MAESWTWRAELDDGTVLTEAACGSFSAVPLERCRALTLLPVGWPWGRRLVRVAADLAAGERVTFCRRRRLTVLFNGTGKRQEPTVTIVGLAGGACLAVNGDGDVTLVGAAAAL